MTEWLRVAIEPAIMRRALKCAVVVGAILISINHGDALLRGDITTARLLKMGLTVIVPYLVSTFSSVGTIQELRRKATLAHDRGSDQYQAVGR